MTYLFTTERLGFRTWAAEDLPLALALWGDAEVMSLLGGPLSEAAVRERLAAERRTWEEAEVQYWPIFLLKTGEPAGCAGLTPWAAGGLGCLMAGVHLHRAVWGRRLGEEAGREILRYGWERKGASSIVAGHHPENHASKRLLTALGFEFERMHLWPPTGLMHPFYRISRAEGSR